MAREHGRVWVGVKVEVRKAHARPMDTTTAGSGPVVLGRCPTVRGGPRGPMVGGGPTGYDSGKEAAVIERTDQQVESLGHSEAAPPRVVNTRMKEVFILLRVDEYERLKAGEYDDSPWTREELQAQAWAVAERAGWEEYDGPPGKP